MLNTVSRIRGQVKAVGYPQTEGMLGDCMLHYGRELGVGSAFGTSTIVTHMERTVSAYSQHISYHILLPHFIHIQIRLWAS